MKTLQLGVDRLSVPVPAVPFGLGMVAVLTADTEGQFTIPGGAKYVKFEADADFWCKIDADATATTVPGASVTTETGQMLSPVMLELPKDATTVHLIGGADVNISISFFN